MGQVPGASLAVCSRCGVAADGDDGMPPLDWMCEVDQAGGLRFVCVACARTHVRAIEGKLDPDWW